MRLFTGIALPREIAARLETLVLRLKPAARIKWGRVANLHITTKFIGEWPAERLDEVKESLSELPPRAAIPISIRGLGWYPNERAPRVFWAGIDAPAALQELAGETDRALVELGIRAEKRKYSPHLTLARIKGATELSRLRRELERLPSSEFGEFQARSFHLYLSELKSTGSVYTSLGEFPMGEA